MRYEKDDLNEGTSRYQPPLHPTKTILHNHNRFHHRPATRRKLAVVQLLIQHHSYSNLLVLKSEDPNPWTKGLEGRWLSDCILQPRCAILGSAKGLNLWSRQALHKWVLAQGLHQSRCALASDNSLPPKRWWAVRTDQCHPWNRTLILSRRLLERIGSSLTHNPRRAKCILYKPY
jgi:hypothetical protein